ncbi:SigB/SigF/SigG family RNA polymerase sigma factor [Atopobium sp. oral taxon 810]|uniref:SigB/SigF/SigG family RNA polymerase sigma factor n=1 Tax=Atopobium sp. oral taxon 810 TaxID=712158 RepID=UPI000397B3EE|nr:SigB/SigF/SigG family RNA polymerase sigma factor [Atopobium sp. oral taxon 810]ERI04136.1 putative RNA polymerase sigma-F factor [Atopobium sp. oral taxon 810 str. F0209]
MSSNETFPTTNSEPKLALGAVADKPNSSHLPLSELSQTDEARSARRRARARARVSGRPVWDRDRTSELFAQYRAGDEDARQQLIVNHLNLVRFLASKFKNRGEPLEDLIQVGTIGLIKAIDRFEPDRGLEFTTYATPTIMGEIKRHFRDKGWSVRIPRRLQELSQKVSVATETLTRELQHSPSVEELAEHVGATVDEVLEAMESSSAYSSVPLESGKSEDDESAAVIDRYVTIDQDLEGSDDRMLLEQAMTDFSPRERDIVRMRFVEGLTQVEIAEKLGISQVQVSRLLRRTLSKMQERIEAKPKDKSEDKTKK